MVGAPSNLYSYLDSLIANKIGRMFYRIVLISHEVKKLRFWTKRYTYAQGKNEATQVSKRINIKNVSSLAYSNEWYLY